MAAQHKRRRAPWGTLIIAIVLLAVGVAILVYVPSSPLDRTHITIDTSNPGQATLPPTASPPTAAHRRAVPSFEAVKMRVPSGLKWAMRTPLRCCIGAPIAAPLDASQTCAASAGAACTVVGQTSALARSAESAAVTTRNPSRLNST